MGFRESAIRLLGTVNATGFVLVSLALFFLDTGVTYFIIQKVPYTEIDWSTYMQQVECYLKKRQLNYSLIEGDTGPIVYPGGHLSVYSWLYSFTNGGKDIRTGQFIFMGLYMLNLLLVLRLYYKSNKIVPIVLPFLVITGYRIHSIFVLRLFNDPIAMFFFYLAANLFISQWWFFGCLFYSFAVSIKMNVLLFAPALFFVLLLNNGMWWTVVYLSVCAVIQLYMGLPFLIYDPVSYLKRSFDLGRVFFYEWTVNWRFLPEETFLDKRLHIALLLFHIVVLGIFGFHMWFRSHGGLKASLLELSHGIRTRTGVAETLFALFSANLIGIAFSRSLHYQFYSWYFHQLPFLLFWNSGDILTFKQLLFTFSKGGLLLLIEYSWNTFPSTPTSSLLLHFSHAVILLYLVFTRVERYKRKFKMITRLLCRPSTSLAGRCLSSGQKTTEEPKLDTLPAHLRVFDRKMKTAQRNWAVRQPDFEAAQYLKEEVGWRIADRVFDLTKFNKLALEIGCGVGHIAPHMIKENIGTLVQCDMSQFMVEKSKGAEDNEVVIERVHCDEEQLQPFEANQFDLLLSSLSAHWINDLPGWFRRCHELLKPNCPLLGAMLAADTLFELRCSLQLAEMERTGGVGSHISPFVQAQDVGGLLNKAGFDMITLDLDEIEVGFPNMFALLYDLQLMAESNCTIRRSPTIRKDVLVAAEAIYRAMYAKDDKFPATFKVLSFIGWKPGQNMPKPVKRGSQNVSLKDLSKIVENPELAESLSKNRKKE